MRNLSQFTDFDWDRFSSGKVFVCTGTRPWKDHDSGTVLGTVVDAAIVKDETVYKMKPGEIGSNRFEKISFKVPKQNFAIPVDAIVRPIGAKATVWGDYRNQLSVKADDVEIVDRTKAKES